MKLGLEAKIAKSIEAYKANSQSQKEAIIAAVEPFKVPSYASRFTTEGLQETIKEKMDAIMKQWKQYDITLNQRTKEIVAIAKDSLLAELKVNNPARSADYATRIANAREFLKDELVNISFNTVPTPKQAAEFDSLIYPILKDFIDDQETMRLFHRMIERKMAMEDGYVGETIFPKTFGRYGKIENMLKAITDLEACTETLFIHAKSGGQEIFRYNGMLFYCPEDGYTEIAAEEEAVNIAVILDDIADHINSEGQLVVSGGSVSRM